MHLRDIMLNMSFRSSEKEQDKMTADIELRSRHGKFGCLPRP